MSADIFGFWDDYTKREGFKMMDTIISHLSLSRALISARCLTALGLFAGLLCPLAAHASGSIDLNDAVVVVRPGDLPNAERAAATILVEEIEKRTGIHLETVSKWPASKPVIAISSEPSVPAWNRDLPAALWSQEEEVPQAAPDSYRLLGDAEANVVWLLGKDARGTLYAAGALLRKLEWASDTAIVPMPLDIQTQPAYPIRGHQLGYRAQANSWDAWSVDQFDQYIRELTFFGLNSVEGIPFQDERTTPVMKVGRREMNRALSHICGRYGLNYWAWTPAECDLKDIVARTKALEDHEAFYRDCETLSGVFFPGGDPGDNPAQLVIPFLEDIARRLLPLHPNARVWLSLQHFSREEVDYVFEYIRTEKPSWLGGLVAGPSGPPVPITRNRLPDEYQLRLYPDITHNKICQFPVPWWDQAYALTLGREAINPRPAHYAYIHNWFAPYSSGFITYSDGVHDDVNKTVFSGLGWNPNADIHEILADYCRVFFGPKVAESATDGILALEKNWEGPLKDNGGVEGTRLLWKALESQMPQLEGNWRWQMCLLRAHYDAYIRHRLLNETRLELEAYACLDRFQDHKSSELMAGAMAVLNRAVNEPVDPELRERIVGLCDALYQSIGLQTSVEKYHAIDEERGAILDFLDYPLNNRWWLEDEFKKVEQLHSESGKIDRLITIKNWTAPSCDGFYDDIGNPANSPHVKRSRFVFTEPDEEAHPEPTFWWWENGFSRARLSWQVTMNYPEAVVYEGLEPNWSYTIRCSGFGKVLLCIDGEPVYETPTRSLELGEVQDFVVPARFLTDRKLVLTWESPSDEDHLNWRQHSRLSEVWLLKECGC